MSEGRETNDSQSYNSNDYDEHDEKKFMMNVTKIAVQKREASEDLWKTGFEKKLNMKEKNANANLIQTSTNIK